MSTVFLILFILIAASAVLYSINQSDLSRRRQPPQKSRIQRRGVPGETAEAIRQRVTHAALSRAAVEPNSLPYELTDIGVLVQDNGKPRLVRDLPIPIDTPYLRPFVEITTTQEMQLPVILQILDSQRQVIYRDGGVYAVNGKTVILPQTQLSLKDRDINPTQRWSMWVIVDEVPFAIHPFLWEASLEEKIILHEVSSDGEITDRLRQIVEEADMSEVSLSELLSDQQNSA
jgi:hypothetical protein